MLYDPGEEGWGTKLHLGCGGIYLMDYVNIDIAGTKTEPGFFPAHNLATVRDYYFLLNGSATHLPKRRETIVDQRADITDLPYTPATVHKILALQVFEHLSPLKAFFALLHWWELLVPSGVLVLTVPNMIETLDMLTTNYQSTPAFAFAMRHLRGSARDRFNHHLAWYTEATLTELVDNQGFDVTVIENPHFYPAIAIRGVKRA